MVFGGHALGRHYATVIDGIFVDGIDANLDQVRSAMAWCYTRYLSEASFEIQASYRQGEAEARGGRRGLWSDPEPVEPWL